MGALQREVKIKLLKQSAWVCVCAFVCVRVFVSVYVCACACMRALGVGEDTSPLTHAHTKSNAKLPWGGHEGQKNWVWWS